MIHCTRRCTRSGLVLVGALALASGALAEELAVLYTEEPGFYSVSGEELAAALPGESLPEGGLPAAGLRLLWRGEPQPLRIEGGEDGRLDAGDRLVFFGRRNPAASTDLAAFVLIRDGMPSRPLPDEVPAEELAGPRRDVFAPVATLDPGLCGQAGVEHWVVAVLPPGGRAQRVDLGGTERMTAQPGPVILELVLQGYRARDARNRVTLQVAGRRLPDVVWTGPGSCVHRVELEPGDLEGWPLQVELSNQSEDLHHTLTGRSLDVVVVNEVSLRAPVTYRLAEGPARPSHIAAWSGEDLRKGGADYLVITTRELAGEVSPLLEWRRRGGLRPRLVTIDQVYQQFAGGEPDPEAVLRFVRAARAGWDPAPRFLLLVGDTDHDGGRSHPFDSVPTCMVDVCGNGASASDVPYACQEGDPLPSLAVGRLPTRDPATLAVLVQKTIEYERDLTPGRWRRRLAMITGESRFGPAIDSAVERVATEMIGKLIPPGYDVNVTFASEGSPFVYPPQRFNEKVLDRINEGSLFVTYIGHGARTRLDRLRWRGKLFPILSSEHVPEVEVREGLPVMVLLACLTGYFDDPRAPCLSEELLARPRGPVAVVSASRVSYPYPNTLLAEAFIQVFFAERERTLGEGLNRVRREVVQGKGAYRQLIDAAAVVFLPDPGTMPRERLDQVYLYNLLGDPALQLALPAREAVVVAPARARAGDRIPVRARLPGVESGEAWVSLEIQRTALLRPLERVDPDDPGADEVLARNYASANDKIAVEIRVPVTGERLACDLEIPPDLRDGRYWVKVYGAGAAGDAMGATPMRLGEEEPPPVEPGADDVF